MPPGLGLLLSLGQGQGLDLVAQPAHHDHQLDLARVGQTLEEAERRRGGVRFLRAFPGAMVTSGESSGSG